MLYLLLILCLIFLFFLPVLYSSIASFAAIFFVVIKPQGRLIAQTLIYSSAIVSALVAATINHWADTAVYLESYQEVIYKVSQGEFDLEGQFEPLFELYEYLSAVVIGDRNLIYLLVSSLIYNVLSAFAIFRICARLDQFNLAPFIFCLYYSLCTPQMGVPMFLMRQGIALALLLAGISYYKQRNRLCYLLCLASTAFHASSLFVLGAMLSWDIWLRLSHALENLREFLWLNRKYAQKLLLIFIIVILLLTSVGSGALMPVIGAVLQSYYESGLAGGIKAKSFLLSAEAGALLRITNPVFFTQVLITLTCFLKIRKDFRQAATRDDSIKNQFSFLQAIRSIGKFQLLIIFLTFSFNALPLRLGFLSFMYFPIWLINLPFLEVSPKLIRNQFRFLTVLALISTLLFSIYRIPKNQSAGEAGLRISDVVVLDGKPLSANIVQVTAYFFNTQ